MITSRTVELPDGRRSAGRCGTDGTGVRAVPTIAREKVDNDRALSVGVLFQTSAFGRQLERCPAVVPSPSHAGGSARES